MSRSYKSKRTNRSEQSQRLLDRLDALYRMQDDLLATIQHYANFQGYLGTLDVSYKSDLDQVNDEIAHLEARL